MKLEQLQLRNFRQFYGEQVLRFAMDPQLNVTVIHGYNGAGKTALLNAFVWCLYGETTPDLEASERLVNERAIADCPVSTPVAVRVRLRYACGGSTYIADRTATATRMPDGCVKQGRAELNLFRVSENCIGPA